MSAVSQRRLITAYLWRSAASDGFEGSQKRELVSVHAGYEKIPPMRNSNLLIAE